MFFEPALFSLGLLFLAMLVIYKKIKIKKIIAYTAGSFLAAHVFMIAAFKFNFVTTLMSIAQTSSLGIAYRPYTIWLFENLRNFFIGAGIVPSLLFILACIMIFKIKKSASIITLATLMTIIILDISGLYKGEVARLWIFLMPFIHIIAAYYIAEKLHPRTFYLTIICTIIQSSIAMSMVGFVIPYILIPLA